ncbi:MAG: TonB-dependent receptor [Crocinitomix sp.]|nr:TonB-dependent receptor [Crocinitomix sp.]
MRRILFILIFLIASSVNAQSINVFGRVTDSIANPIPGATVMLMGQQDSILKTFAVTDNEGNFVLKNVKSNAYLFKANSYGNQPYELLFSTTEASSDTSIGVIKLQPLMLDVVNVSSEYIPIRFKGDTIEYDSRAFETGEHDVVENLLAQLPGVEVQPDGSIKVRGKTVEKILVDGEEFFGSDPTIATKNLPADAVDRVQVFEKASDMAAFTGVADGNESTTINLKLKEDRKKGYFGNLEAAFGAGLNPDAEGLEAQNRYRLKGNVHYFKGKWQVSGIGLSNNVNETGFSINDYVSFMGGIQNLMDGSGSINIGGDNGLPISDGQNTGFLSTNATGFNLNYKPSQKATLSSSFFFNTFDKSFDRSVDRTTFFQDSSVFSQEDVLQKSATLNSRGTIHYKQEFDSTHFLNLDLNGNWTNAKYSNSNDLLSFDSEQNLKNTYTTNLDQNSFDYNMNLAADYRKKFAKKGRYTGGGATYGLSNKTGLTNLTYENILYLPGPVISQTIQMQNNSQKNANVSGNWMYSEPLSKKHLLQAEVEHKRKNFLRDKTVSDEITADELVLNPLFSGNATYATIENNGELRYKFLSKKLKTTVGLGYSNLNLLSADLFETNRTYHYALPFFRLQLEVSKSSEFRVDYRTNVRAPQIIQLQAIPDNTNPAEIVQGNVNLIPEYVHDLNVEYNFFNQFNFTNLMLRLGAKHVENKINYSQVIDANFNRQFTPDNNGNEDRLNAYTSFGTNLSPIKTKFSITNNATISKGQLRLNGAPNSYTSFYNNSRLIIENTKKKVINIKAGVEMTYSKSVYPENEMLNSDFFSWNYSADLTLKLKDKWVFKADAKHYFYPSFETNNEQIIVNTSIARNLLKSKKLQAYVAVYDLLNQNSGINQNYFLNYYEQQRTATLARYFMLGLKFSFQKLGAK